MLAALSGTPISASRANPAPGGDRNHHRNYSVQRQKNVVESRLRHVEPEKKAADNCTAYPRREERPETTASEDLQSTRTAREVRWRHDLIVHPPVVDATSRRDVASARGSGISHA